MPLEFIAIVLALSGFILIAWYSENPPKMVILANWLLVVGFGIQFLLLNSLEPRAPQPNEITAIAALDMQCDANQLEAIKDVTFFDTIKTRNGFGFSKEVTVLNEQKLTERLANLSELIICLNEKLEIVAGAPNSEP